MISLLTGRYGKIGAGTSINEGGKTKAALALRPFSHGRYDIYKRGENYNISGAEVLQSFFSIGEDLDRFMGASYVLELTDRLLPDGQPSPAVFNLLLDFLSCIEKRKSAFGTLLIAYQLKLLALSGCAPILDRCTRCGCDGPLERFSISDGGLLCGNCLNERDLAGGLSFPFNAESAKALGYMQTHSLASLEKLALSEKIEGPASLVMKEYISHHLGISNLRSEKMEI